MWILNPKVSLLIHFCYNFIFPQKFKTRTFNHILMPVIQYNFKKISPTNLEKNLKSLNVCQELQFQKNLKDRIREQLRS